MNNLQKIVCGIFALLQTATVSPTFAASLQPTAISEGMAALKLKQYPRAVQVFEHILSHSRPAPKTLYLCALANFQANNNKRAWQILGYLSNTYPNSMEAHLGRLLGQKMGFSNDSTTQNTVASGSTTTLFAKSSSNLEAAQTGISTELARLPQTARIRFKRGEQGHMLVDAYINGHLTPAWFDTGATGYMDFKTLTNAGINAPSGAPQSYSRGWAGTPVPMWKKNIQVRIGDLTRNLNVGIQKTDENSSIMPLIGQDFIQGYTYTIDDKGGWLILTKKGSQASSSQNTAYDVPCVKRGNDDFVKLEANGRKLDAFIDTGAARTIMDLGTFYSLGLTIPSDAPRYGMTGVGGDFACYEVEVDLNLGPLKKPSHKLLVGGTAGTCIGQDFLQGARYTVDRDKNLMRFFH